MTSRKRNYRRKRSNDDEAEDDNKLSVTEKLEEVREAQKFRIRQKGVNAVGLAFGEKFDQEENVIDDPFKLKTGGLIDINAVKDRNRDRSDEATDKDVTNLGSNFSLETNKRDEDVEMLRFIEDKLARNRGRDESDMKKISKPKTKEDLLYEVPSHINVSSKIMKSEEMLSNQMLSGIPEVDLGIDAKIKNIEATEEAKFKFINESKNKKHTSSDFVPTNLASNFLHHERFFNEQKAMDHEKRKELARKEEEVAGPDKCKGPVVSEDIIDSESYQETNKNTSQKGKRKGKNEASDDYMYEKFKKKTRDSWRYQ